MMADGARFLALGDSYTAGEGVPAAESWPAQLVSALRDSGYAVRDAEVVATTGWTTDELAAAIDVAQPAGPFQLVTLLIGVNNQYRGRPVAEYRSQFAALLRRAVALAGGEPGRVLVLSIPDWGVTPFAGDRDRAAIATEIDAFNTVARDEATAASAQWLDVTATSRRMAESVVVDGLHPDAVQYAEWARLALPCAQDVLGAPSPEAG